MLHAVAFAKHRLTGNRAIVYEVEIQKGIEDVTMFLVDNITYSSELLDSDSLDDSWNVEWL